MARLVVKLHGKESLAIELIEGREYIAGRNQGCDIPLENQKGISRNHLKISQIEGQWIARLISRYGSLVYEGKVVESIPLEEETVFQIPPYDFHFFLNFYDPRSSHDFPDGNEKSHSNSISPPLEHQVPENQQQYKYQSTEADHIEESSSNQNQKANLDITSPGDVQLVPYLRIRYPGREKDEILELEGHLWVAGRDAQCEISIDDGHISRRHFELNQTQEGLYITDLASANGTAINGIAIPPHEPHPLLSGDQISIMDLTIIVELRDKDFKDKFLAVRQLPHVQAPSSTGLPTAFNPNLYFDPTGPSAVKLQTSNRQRPQDRLRNLGQNKIRLALIILIPVLALSYFLKSSPQKGQKTNSSLDQPGAKFDGLSSDQKIAVKDIYNLARGHYTQGRYELCLAELNKLHGIIPLYEDSKNLQAHCSQGLEMTMENQELERKERIRIETQKKIEYIVQDCKRRLGNSSSMDQAKDCLGPAIELDPSNPGALAILAEIQLREERIRQEEIATANRKSRIQAGKNQYAKAKTLYKKGQLRKAISAYESFLQAQYPESSQLEKRAQRELASVKKDLNNKVQIGLTECKTQYDQKNYRPAIEACDKALTEDPNNREATELRAQVLSDLRREMRSIYEDSILEESLGEIEGAKEKWRKIIQSDIPSDEYFQKATRKLKKYGIGI